MVSRVTVAASLAAGLACQMKAVATTVIAGERSVLVLDPNSPDLAAAYPLVTATDRNRLIRDRVAEDFDGQLPSPEEQADVARQFQQQQYQDAVQRAKTANLPPPTEPFPIAPIYPAGVGVDANAASKVAWSEQLQADQSVSATTGLSYRQTTHYQHGPEGEGLTGTRLAAATTATGGDVLSKPELEQAQQAEAEAGDNIGPVQTDGSISGEDPDAAPAAPRKRAK